MKNFFAKINIVFQSYEGKLFFITFFVHLVFIFLLNYGIIKVPNSGNDYMDYHNHAVNIANLLHSGTYTLGAVYSSHWYPFFVGVLYFLFYPSIILGTSINAIFISFSAVFMFKIISLINKNINKKTIFWISLLTMNISASLLYVSSFLFKDAAILFLVLAGTYVGLKTLQDKRLDWLCFFIFLLIFILLFYLRFFIAYGILIGFLFYWFTNGDFSFKKKIINNIIILFIFSTTIFFVNNIDISNSFKKTKDDSFNITKIFDLKFIANMRYLYFKGGESTTNINVVEEDSLSGGYHFSFLGITKSTINTILGPFPWQLSFKKYIYIFPDVFIWILTLILASVGILKTKIKIIIFPLISGLFIIAGLVMGSDNLGALLRYRLPLFVILAVMASFGLVELQKNKKIILILNSIKLTQTYSFIFKKK